VERGVEVEILPQAVAERIAITVYRPLLIGLLAGKYNPALPLPPDSRGQTDPRIRQWLEKYGSSFLAFQEYAAAHDLHPAQLALAWLQHAPGVTASIVGVSALDQLQPTIQAFDIELTQEQFHAVTALFDTGVKEEAGGKFPFFRRLVDLTS
jgi:aryl-alcohol dehydrogenase-like predicted oxidoreductase